jgi:hypothetical protein
MHPAISSDLNASVANVVAVFKMYSEHSSSILKHDIFLLHAFSSPYRRLPSISPVSLFFVQGAHHLTFDTVDYESIRKLEFRCLLTERNLLSVAIQAPIMISRLILTKDNVTHPYAVQFQQGYS